MIDYPFSPREVTEFSRTYYGPINRAFTGIDADGQAALRSDLEQLWAAHSLSSNGVTRHAYEYLEVVAVRA